MELEEAARIIFQALLNNPEDAPEHSEAFEALELLYTRLNYTPPAYVIEKPIGGYTYVRLM